MPWRNQPRSRWRHGIRLRSAVRPRWRNENFCANGTRREKTHQPSRKRHPSAEKSPRKIKARHFLKHPQKLCHVKNSIRSATRLHDGHLSQSPCGNLWRSRCILRTVFAHRKWKATRKRPAGFGNFQSAAFQFRKADLCKNRAANYCKQRR